MPKNSKKKKEEAAVHAFLSQWRNVAEEWENEEMHSANFHLELKPFFEGTEDAHLVDLVGHADDGSSVSTFPIVETSSLVRFDFLDHTFDLGLPGPEVAAKLMVEVCCGLLVHRILTQPEKFRIPKDLDFKKSVFRRISWNPVNHAWMLFFTFDSKA